MFQTTFAHYVAYGLIAIGALLPMVVCWRLLTKGRKLCVQKDFRGVRTLYVQHMQLVVFVSVLLIFVTLALGLSPVASLLLIPSFVLPVVAVEWWVLHRHYPRARLFELLPQVAPYQHTFSVKIPANEQAVGESLAGIRQFMTNMLPFGAAQLQNKAVYRRTAGDDCTGEQCQQLHDRVAYHVFR